MPLMFSSKFFRVRELYNFNNFPKVHSNLIPKPNTDRSIKIYLLCKYHLFINYDTHLSSLKYFVIETMNPIFPAI